MIVFFDYLMWFLCCLFGFYLIFNCLYLFFFAIAGHFFPKTNNRRSTIGKRICILIPAYKEDAVIIESSYRAVNHHYIGKFNVVVVADGLNNSTIDKISEFGCKVIPVKFEKSTKGKSLLFAMDQIGDELYDIAVVLDIDNVMADNFLNDVNDAFGIETKVIQTHRTAKNLDTAFAFLDACNEEINNHIYRKGHFAVGLSPALIGSGMAFEFKYLHNLLTDIGDTVGEDKEMDFKIAKNKDKIIYLNNTYVFDEKIENSAVFTQQRTRWIAAQIEFIKKYFIQGFKELFVNRNFEFFNKMLQSVLIPRMLLLGLLFFLAIGSFVFLEGSGRFFCAYLFISLCVTLLISLPIRFYKDKRLILAVLRIPYACWCMLLALLRIRRVKTSFLPTPHKSNSKE